MAMTHDMVQPAEALTNTVLESLVTRGDISGLRPADKLRYYSQLCERVGLDPATTPFQPLKLNGKEILYATKGAAEQLRNLHKISITITARDRIEDVYYVTARATMPDGRTDESQGAVPVGNMKGADLANAVMKAETKAKRRVTLSIVGLGMLDESELDTVQGDKFAAIAPEQPRSAPVVQVVKEPQPANPNKPQRWTEKEPLPVLILKSIPALRDLKDIPLDRMGQDDLDLVVEQGKQAYTAWAGTGSAAPKALALLQEIVVMAQRRLNAFNGDVPPPSDEPPPDFDPVTGEVHQ